MRVYVATTAGKLEQLLSGSATFDEYLTPGQFEFPQGVTEEEQENLVSLLAAEDAFEISGGKYALVLAVDLAEAQLNGEAITLEPSQVAAALYSESAEELSWFAPDEIPYKLSEWLS